MTQLDTFCYSLKTFKLSCHLKSGAELLNKNGEIPQAQIFEILYDKSLIVVKVF